MRDWLVVDASVVVKWYIPEPGSDRASALLDTEHHLLAPDLVLSEVGNVLWKRRKDLAAPEIEAIAEVLVSTLPVALYPSRDLLPGALLIACAYNRSVYDSLYLALAVRQDCRFVTADERLSNALQGTPLEPYVTLL